jgi:hypothetical protein
MNAKLAFALVAAVLVVMALFSNASLSFAQDRTLIFHLSNSSDGNYSHNLNIIVPQTLTDYYNGLSHRSVSDADFPKFVTPYAVQPIADCLRQIYPDDKDFANGVLTLVHQVPFEETIPAYYPVETLQRNKGDCDMVSVLAASVLKAGGLDAVLIHYPDDEHMNIGVHLVQAPEGERFNVTWLEHDGVAYYIGECTGSFWRVGESPSDLKNASAIIIPLTNSEQVAPGEVSASFKQLESTSLSVQISPAFTLAGSTVTVRGQISPAMPNQNVTLYSSAEGSTWTVIDTTQTLQNGQFFYSWNPQVAGDVEVRASWTGNNQYAGTTSTTQNTFIMPISLLALIALAVIAVAACVTAFVLTIGKRKQQTPLLPPPPPDGAVGPESPVTS